MVDKEVLDAIEGLNPEELGEVLFDMDRDHYSQKPVGIGEFCSSTDFLGGVFEGEFLEFWRKELGVIYPNPVYSPFFEVITLLPIGSGKCLVEGTMVETSNGQLPIEVVVELVGSGHRIEVWSEEGKRPVLSGIRNGKQSVRRVRFRSGRELSGTPEHRVRAWTGTELVWRTLRELKKGDSAVIDGREGLFGSRELGEEAYLLGVLSGDGYLGVANEVGFCCGLNFREEERVFVGEVEKCYTLLVGEGTWTLGETNWLYRRVNETYVEELLEEGFGRASEKAVPERVFFANKPGVLGYLAGLIDTDGYVGKGGIEITLVSKKLIVGVQHLLSQLGVDSVFGPKLVDGQVYWRLKIRGRTNLQKLSGLDLRVSYKKFALEALLSRRYSNNDRRTIPGSNGWWRGVFESLRGREVVRGSEWNWFGAANKGSTQKVTLEVVSKAAARFGGSLNLGDGQRLLDWDANFDEVVAVEDGEGETFDLEVEGTPTYRVGGLISHNTTTANVSVLYEIYKLLCLKNPHAYYKIRPEGVQIVFSLFSAAKTLAEDVNWASMESMLDGSPWFRRYCPLPSTRKVNHEKGTCDLAKNVGIKLGSVSGHAIGMAVFGGVLDEADFQRKKSEQAKSSYLAILRRMESRFLQRGGVIPGKLWLLSSPKHATDFLEERIKESKKAKRTRVIRDTPIWVIRKDRGIFSKNCFKVFIGDTTRDPAILDPSKGVDPELASRTIDVPVELRDSFEKDLLAALNDHAGVSTASAINLIKHPSKLAKVAVLKGRFKQEILELDFEDPGDMIENYTDMSYFRNPDSPESFRFLHLDLGVSNDKLGFACVYAVPKQYEVRGAEKGSRLGRGRQYILDFLLSIRAKKGQEILIRKLEDFVLSLKAARYPIKLITTDQYQCLVGETWVCVRTGHKRLSDVLVGDEVWSRGSWRRVMKKFKYENAPLIEVTTNRGIRLVGTPSHKMSVCSSGRRMVRGKWVRDYEFQSLGTLKKGDEIEYSSESEISGRYPQRINLRVSKWGVYGRLFFESLTEDLALILGLAHGDGCWASRKVRLHFGSESEGRQFQEMLAKYDVFPELNGEGTKWAINFGGTGFFDWAKAKGFVGDAHNKCIPRIILESPKSVVAAYLRGLFSADGHCTGVKGCEGQVCLVTVSKETAVQVQVLLRDLYGIGSSLCEVEYDVEKGAYKEGKCYRVATNGPRERFLAEIGLFYEEKKRVLLENRAILGRTTFEKVKSVRGAGRGTVYDIMVEGVPVYSANGLVSHNSTQFRQTLKLAGIPTGTLSVDGTRDPFLSLRSSIYGEAILLTDGPLLTRELLELRDDGKKIDHPTHGSKDASDGLAGAHWNCANAEIVYSQIAFKPDKEQGAEPEGMDLGRIMDMMKRAQDERFAEKLYPIHRQ